MKSARRAFDVMTIGAATRDVFVTSRHFESRRDLRAPDGFDACLPLGAKIPIDELVFETGGGATNAAVTFARFGLKTACVSRVGKDAGGMEILDQLKKEKVDVRGIQFDPKVRTAYSFILVAGSGNRAILVARGASKELDGAHIPWNALRSSWLYATSLAGDLKLLKSVFAHAARAGTRIAWNPGNVEIELGLKILKPFIARTDVLILNREEAAALCDASPRDLVAILHRLGSLPRVCLVVTDGRHGAYAHARGATWHVPAQKGKVVNTTGAGDAFGSGFTASLIRDGVIETALKAGTVNAHGVVTHMGAKAGILKRAPGKRDLSRVAVRRIN